MPEDINRPPSACPGAVGATARWTDDDLAVAVQEAWRLGYVAALTLAAARAADTTYLFEPIPHPTREELIAARVAEMLAGLQQRAARTGAPHREYLGGPVDWHTGVPTRRLEVVA